jgi:hypothetical protein
MSYLLTKRIRGRIRSLIVGWALLGGVAGLAGAQPSADAVATARALADEGANAYAARDYARALALFEHAHRLVPAPTIALFEARTLVQLGRLREARAAYLRVVGAEQRADEPAPFRAAIEAAHAELAQLKSRIPRLHVVVTGKVDEGVVVLLDERQLASSLIPGWLLVDPGAHTLQLRTARGYVAPVSITLAEGESKHVRLDAPPASQRDPRRTFGSIGLGVGSAGVALGVTAGLVALDAHEEAERGCPAKRCVQGTSGADAVERFRDWRTVSTVGYVVGGLGLAAGIVLLLTSEREGAKQVALVSTLGGAHLETTW